MKRFSFCWINQWHIDDAFLTFAPIGVTVDYDLFGPELSLRVALMGFGFQLTFVCPWETEYSQWAKEVEKSMGSVILSLGEDMKGTMDNRHKAEMS